MEPAGSADDECLFSTSLYPSTTYNSCVASPMPLRTTLHSLHDPNANVRQPFPPRRQRLRSHP